jgi:hypothetical protein
VTCPERPVLSLVASLQHAVWMGTSERHAAQHDSATLIEIEQLYNYARFVAGSIWRHRYVGAAVFLMTASATVALAVLWPRTYHVEATLLARRNDLMTSLSNPSRPARPEADDPTRAASELMHQRTNLLSIIQETHLRDRWSATRSPLPKAKDRLLLMLGGDPPELTTVLIGMLEKQLTVNVEKEGIVTIAINWGDATLASELVKAAVDNFVEGRHDTEAAAITEAISILQNSAATLQADVDRTIAQLREEQRKRPQLAPATDSVRRHSPAKAAETAARAASAPPPERPILGPAPEALAELGRLSGAADVKREEIKRLEGQQRERVTDAQTKLAAALAIYTDNHPTVVAMRQNLAAAAGDPVELTQARSELTSLETAYEARAKVARDDARKTEPASPDAPLAPAKYARVDPAPARVPPVDGPMLAIMPTDIARLTDLTQPTSRLLTLQLSQLANLLDRINGARLELATSGAGLKYRYTVTRPPEVPRSPVKPKLLAVVCAGLIAALLLAIITSVALDLVSGVMFETWQVERQIGVPVLAVLRGTPID